MKLADPNTLWYCVFQFPVFCGGLLVSSWGESLRYEQLIKCELLDFDRGSRLINEPEKALKEMTAGFKMILLRANCLGFFYSLVLLRVVQTVIMEHPVEEDPYASFRHYPLDIRTQVRRAFYP